MYPVDLMKVCSARLMYAMCLLTINALQTRLQILNPSPTALYSGLSNAMVTITRVEGFRSLWKGLSSVVLGAGQCGIFRSSNAIIISC